MDYRKQTTPAAAVDCATVLVGIELSAKNWLVGIDRGTKKISQYKVTSGEVGALRRLIANVAAPLREAGRAVRVISCYEAGRDGFYLHRELASHGIENHVLDAASVAVDRRARRAKTDGLDVQMLLWALRSLLRGERHVCRVVRVPSAAEEDAKRPGRERKTLIAERVRHVNRIGSLCALYGITTYHPMRGDRRAQLEALRLRNGEPLPANLKGQIERELDRLELVLKQIALLEAARNAVLKSAAEPEPVTAPASKIRTLASLHAIGVETATLLTREVFYRSFANRRALAGYVGLSPSPYSSGDSNREQGISKAGNPRAHRDDRARLALAEVSAAQRAECVVRQAGRRRQGTHPAHRHRRPGAQAAGRAMALAGKRTDSHGCRDQVGLGPPRAIRG